MIIKGNARAGAKSLADHLLRADTNERVEVVEIFGVVAEDLHGALKEMDAVADCTNTARPFYHASINTPIVERLTPEQRAIAIARLEKELDLTGQPRAVVVHQKEGREHTHIVWSRADIEHSRAIRMDHNFRKHELVGRELEQQFGHERVQGAHVGRDDQPRPKRTPGHDEMQQSARTGWKPAEARRLITGLWQQTDNGHAFEAALAEKGWLLAKGDRRDFVVVDPAGGIHSLARRIEGANAEDVRQRMTDLDGLPMPSAAEARGRQLKIAALEEIFERGKSAAPAIPEMDWSDSGGMVAQQRAALAWLNSVHRAEDRAGAAPNGASTPEASRPSTPPSPSPKAPAKDDGPKSFNELFPDNDKDRDR